MSRDVHEDAADSTVYKLHCHCMFYQSTPFQAQYMAEPFIPPFPDVANEVVRTSLCAGLCVNASASYPVKAPCVRPIDSSHGARIKSPGLAPVGEKGAYHRLVEEYF